MKMFKNVKEILSAIDEHPLAGKHLVKAYTRFIKWQFSQALFPGLKKIRFVENTFMLVRKGMTGATGNIYCGLHEFEDMAFLLHFLREEDTFLDIGANVGSYTLLASGVKKAYSISFEPAPGTFISFSANIKLNKLEKLTELYNAAAGAAEAKMRFTIDYDTVNHVLAKDEIVKNYIDVPVFPADKFLEHKCNIRLIKIDVEGFETEVLNGMSRLLADKELKAIIIELNGSGTRYGYDEEKIHHKLSLCGFVAYRYEPFQRHFEKLERFNSLNTVYIKDINFVKERIRTAKKISILSEKF